MSAVSFNVAPELERVRDGLGGGGGAQTPFAAGETKTGKGV